MRVWIALLSAFAGLFGAAGVALAAAGAHKIADPRMTTAAYFLLFHAAALVGFCALAQASRSRLVLASASLIGLGALLFSGDLALRAGAHVAVVKFAAPTGGILMIAGWAMAAVSLPFALYRRDA